MKGEGITVYYAVMPFLSREAAAKAFGSYLGEIISSEDFPLMKTIYADAKTIRLKGEEEDDSG